MRIVIIGVGALGSHFALSSRNLGDLVLVDGDRVEMKNVLSQVHTKLGVGKNKTVSLSQVLSLFDKKTTTMPVMVTQANVDVVLQKADLVVDCMDNGRSRRLVQDAVRGARIPCIHGAVDAQGTFGRVIWDQDFVVDDEDVTGAPTCEDGENLPFSALVASYLTMSVRDFVRTGRMVSYQIYPGGVTRI